MQEAVGHDAAFREGFELVFDKLQRVGAGSVFGQIILEDGGFLVAVTRTQELGYFKFASVLARAAARAGEAFLIYQHNCGIGAMALLPPAQT